VIISIKQRQPAQDPRTRGGIIIVLKRCRNPAELFIIPAAAPDPGGAASIPHGANVTQCNYIISNIKYIMVEYKRRQPHRDHTGTRQPGRKTEWN